MPVTILDIEDMKLGARRKAEKLLKAFEFRFRQPEIDAGLNMSLQQIYRKVNPKTAKRIDELFTGGRDGWPD